VTPLETEVLAEVTPSAEEQAALDAVVAELVRRCDGQLAAAGLPGRAAVQGSVAKGTWLRGGGGADIDLFLLLDPSVPQDRLEAVALQVGPQVLEGCQKKYAQHPYLTGTFQGHDVDLVPAYAVAEAGAKMSAVDRTPFHTTWVKEHLGAHKRGQARLLKRWLKGIGAYGAQTAIGGFSGYLVEVLVARFSSFDGVLGWLAGGAQPRRIALGADQVTDEVAPLVVVDPIDPARNCAAAVSAPTLDLAIVAAKAYRRSPGRRFFFPNPARAELPATLGESLTARDASWAGALLRPKSRRLDIVFPQFQRAARSLEAGLAHAGFAVRRLDVAVSDDEREVFLQFVCDGEALPARRTHTGPVDDGRPNAKRFREKWAGHADALGPVHAGPEGKLQVELVVRLRTPAAWLAARLPQEPLGKHVQDALEGHQVYSDAGAVPPAWGPRVADVVLDRKPWER
jgi:tRNA nucleotidyltransferase (CCA-adding enzyme)